MPSESNSSAPSSGPTSRNAPKDPALSHLSESDFLARQANDAKAAISRVSGEVLKDLGRSIDPRGWMQSAPWTTLAAAALAGFAGTALAVPSKEEQALRRLRKLEQALHANEEERRQARSSGNGHDRDDDRGTGTKDHSILGMLAGHAFGLLKPLITSALSAALTAHTVQPDGPAPSADGNGGGSAPPG